MPPQLYPFLTACSATEPAVARALAQVFGLTLVVPLELEVALGLWLPQLGPLGLGRMCCGYHA
jgi:hypothetical protein